MKIDRHNYEEFFILYMDNELTAEDRAAVELFVQAHPDLAEELAMLQQAKLIPGQDPAFPDKENLLSIPAQSVITPDNYEEWLLLYTDNELTAEQQTAVDNFVFRHPAAKAELELLLKTKLQSPVIIYPYKKQLYHREETTRRVVALRWWKITAAAILLLVAGLSAVYMMNNKTVAVETGIASTNDTSKKIRTGVTVPQSVQADIAESAITQPDTGIVIVTSAGKTTARPLPSLKERVTNTASPDQGTRNPAKQNSLGEEPLMASVDNSNPNNLAEPRFNRNITGHIDNPIAYVEQPKTALTNLQENRPTINVTPATAVAYNNQTTEVVDDQPEKKSKLRGLLRKVTRTFEKTTNIKATDENDRLLVAGLAIQL